MPLPDADSSTDEDNSPVLPHEGSDEGSDAGSVVTKPVSGSFSSLIDYDPANTSDMSERASASPESFIRTEPIPSVRVYLTNSYRVCSTNQHSALSSLSSD